MRKGLLLLACAVGLSACAPKAVRHNSAGNERFADEAYEEAIDEYRLAQVSAPDRAEPYYNAANAYNRMSQVDTALAQTEQALKTADPALATQAWYNLGNAFFGAEKWPQAVEAYKEALRLRPGDGEAKHNLELALQKLEQQQAQQEQQAQQGQQGQQSEERHGQDDQREQGQQAGATPTPTAGSDSDVVQGNGGQETPQPSGTLGESEGMTEEQAMQLLQALLGDSQTLRERLREIHQVPGPVPAEDW